MRPYRIASRLRMATHRGELQGLLRRNVLANCKTYCPNYLCGFLAMLVMYVCTSPMLLLVLAAVGGGWSHVLRDDDFRGRPWNLQIGSVHVPLGTNIKLLVLCLPTLVCLYVFLGPVIWSAAISSGGLAIVHASLQDSTDYHDDGDYGP